jgi:hypothetical protein
VPAEQPKDKHCYVIGCGAWVAVEETVFKYLKRFVPCVNLSKETRTKINLNMEMNIKMLSIVIFLSKDNLQVCRVILIRVVFYLQSI